MCLAFNILQIPDTHCCPRLRMVSACRIYYFCLCKMYSRLIHFCPPVSGRPLESLSLSRKRVSDDLAK